MKLSAQSPCKTLALPLVLLSLVSCSQGIDSTTHCSKIQSVYTGSKNSPPDAPNLAFGGYIDVLQRSEPLASMTADKSTLGIRRCTFTLDFEKKSGGEISTFIWTGQHCLAAHLAEDVTLKLFDSASQNYQSFPVSLQNVERAKKIRKDSVSLPVKLQGDLLSSFAIGGNEATAKAVDYCKKISEVAAAGEDQSVCASTYDLGRFEIAFVGEQSPQQKALIKKASDGYFQKYQELVDALKASSAKLEEKVHIFAWMSYMSAASSIREGVGVSQLVTRILACKPPMQEEMCAHKSKVEALFPEAFAEAKLFTFVHPGKTYEQAYKIKLAASEENIALGLKAITRVGTPALNFTLNTNMSHSDAPNADALAQTVGTDATTTFTILPLLSLSSSAEITPDMYKLKEMGITYSVKKNFSTVYFQPGDSGSVVAFRGLFPVAAVSTVNQMPTSGGAVLKPLPKRDETKPNSSDAAPQTGSAEKGKKSQDAGKAKGPC